MNYGQYTAETARYGYRNLVGLVAVSVLVSLALVPLAATALVGTSLALLGGLWTTCLLLGIAAIAAMHFATIVAERGVPIAVRPSVAAAMRNPSTGLVIGVVTFAVAVTSLAVVTVTPGPFRPIATGVAGFLATGWFLLASFASPELGDGEPLSRALRASAGRIGRSPDRVAWFLVLAFACTLIAGVTVVTLLLFLPGVLALLAARAATGADAESGGDRAA